VLPEMTTFAVFAALVAALIGFGFGIAGSNYESSGESASRYIIIVRSVRNALTIIIVLRLAFYRASCKIHRTRRIFPVFAGAERPALRPARA